jgi:DNA-binding response OmpR family regulator
VSILRIDRGASYFVKLNVLVLAADDDFARDVKASIERQYDRSAVRIADNVGDAAESFRETQHDVLIAEMGPDHYDFAQMCRRIRNGGIGAHPFPILTIYLSQPNLVHVRQVIDCGPDDVMAAPLGEGQLLMRLAALSRSRPPFVVTRDYVGPTRRKENPPGSEVIPEIHVPNPLASKIKRQSDLTFRRELDGAMARIDNLKVQRCGVQIAWLTKALTQRIYEIGGTDRSAIALLEQLSTMVRRLCELTARWRLISFEDDALALETVAKAIKSARGALDVRLLEEITNIACRIMDQITRRLAIDAPAIETMPESS